LAAVVAVALKLEPAIADRLSWSSLTNFAGAGRTAAWRQTLSSMSPGDVIFGQAGVGSSVELAEGWVGQLQQIGVVGWVCLGLFWVQTFRKFDRRWSLAVGVTVVTILTIDSSYLDFPTLPLMAAIVATFGPRRVMLSRHFRAPARQPNRFSPARHSERRKNRMIQVGPGGGRSTPWGGSG
jgi:hypothetical protein